jgi:hypothetical protein
LGESIRFAVSVTIRRMIHRQSGSRTFAMRHCTLIYPAFLAALATAAAPARAQDRLADILKKPQLTRQDSATIEAEVSQRARKLADATSASDRQAAREKLVKTAQVPGASARGLSVYAEACAAELRGTLDADELNLALAGVLVLSELGQASTVDALALGLESKHAAVRLVATRALAKLQPKLRGDAALVARVLGAAGRAGAKETDEHVLRAIYELLALLAAVNDGAVPDETAKALNQVLEQRTRRLASGGRDEARDEPAFEIATACYAKASPPEQAGLAANVYSHMTHCVDRYFEEDTAPEYLPTLNGLIQRAEKTLSSMAASAGQKPPIKRVSDAIKGAGAGRSKQEAAARAALEGWSNLLRGEPWQLS